MELSNLLTAIGTIVLAIVTIIYVILTYYILKSSSKATREQLRPFVIVDMLAINDEICLRIRNTGKKAALDVHINISPSFDDILLATDDKSKKWIDYKPLLNQSYISPGYEIILMINFGFRFLEQKEEDKRYLYHVNTNYKDTDNVPYIESYIIDLDALIYAKRIIVYNEVHYLDEISKHLKEIKKNNNSKI